MTDHADEAERHEEAEREAALLRHRNRHHANPHKGVAVVRCIDCGEPIPSGRLAAHPFAVRCIDDARRYELRRKHMVTAASAGPTSLLSPRRRA